MTPVSVACRQCGFKERALCRLSSEGCTKDPLFHPRQSAHVALLCNTRNAHWITHQHIKLYHPIPKRHATFVHWIKRCTQFLLQFFLQSLYIHELFWYSIHQMNNLGFLLFLLIATSLLYNVLEFL